MSVDYSLVNPDGSTVELDETFTEQGGTYALGGTDIAEFNVTYNYSDYLGTAVRVYGRPWDGMVSWLKGRKASETIPELEHVVKMLGDNPTDDYWSATPGNAGHAAAGLLTLARSAPDATWEASG